MRIIVSIVLLIALLYKVTQPVWVSFGYATAMETPLETSDTDAQAQIEVKIHVPLPYGRSWEDTNPNQETYSDSTGIYNIVASRYDNDTLYLTLQPNLNAHAQFDALSSVINELSSQKQDAEKPASNKVALSLSDLLKVFPPPNQLSLHAVADNTQTEEFESVWTYTATTPSHFLAVFAPPPELA